MISDGVTLGAFEKTLSGGGNRRGRGADSRVPWRAAGFPWLP